MIQAQSHKEYAQRQASPLDLADQIQLLRTSARLALRVLNEPSWGGERRNAAEALLHALEMTGGTNG